MEVKRLLKPLKALIKAIFNKCDACSYRMIMSYTTELCKEAAGCGEQINGR